MKPAKKPTSRAVATPEADKSTAHPETSPWGQVCFCPVPPDAPPTQAGELKGGLQEEVKLGKLPADAWECYAGAARKALRIALHEYLRIAREGDPDLIAELPTYTSQMVSACNELARKFPARVSEVAGDLIEWPVLASWHYPKRKDFEELAARIGLGKTSRVVPPAKATWKPDTPINRFLLDVLQGFAATDTRLYLVLYPFAMPRLSQSNALDYLDRLLMPLLDAIRRHEGGWEGIPALRGVLKRVPYEPDHRSAVRNRLKKAVRALACGSG